MRNALKREAVDRLRRDGFLFPIDGIKESQAADYRRQLETFEAANGGLLKGAHRFKTHLLFKWLADLIRSPQMLDPVEDLIGPNILCWTTHWLIKEPCSPTFVSWHQDSNYWGLDTKDLVSVWLALSPATIESGCMKMLPGSHLKKTMPHVDTKAIDNMLTRGQTIIDIDESKAVNVELKTGQVAFFDYSIAHSSPPNSSNDRRIAIVLRYIPPQTKQILADWDSAALVRGKDVYGHFEHEPVPQFDMDPTAVKFHQMAEEMQRKIYFQGTEWQDSRILDDGTEAPY